MVFTGELTHTVVPYAQTVVVCVLKRGGGTPDKHGALESCFPVGFYRGIDSHSGFVCSHSDCLCCEEEEGGGPAKHGALKVVFQ